MLSHKKIQTKEKDEKEQSKVNLTKLGIYKK